MTLFLIAIIIILALVVVLMRRKSGGEGSGETGSDLISEQVREKAANLERVRDFARERGEIANDDVEALLGVSHATAFRYLEELEQAGELRQIGEAGTAVRYTPAEPPNSNVSTR